MKLIIEVSPLCLSSATCYIDPKTGRYSRKEASIWLRNDLSAPAVFDCLNMAIDAWFRHNPIRCALEMRVYLRFGHSETEKVFEMCYLGGGQYTYRYYGRLEYRNKLVNPTQLKEEQ